MFTPSKISEIKACVIGHPVSHSLSPRLHSYWLKQYGIRGLYTHRDIAPHQLASGVTQLVAEGFAGFNVTIPHKQNIIPLLDAVCPLAQAIGAVNTVVIEQGRLIGSNSDTFGFIENLRAHPEFLPQHLHNPVVLGAGGAARAVIKALADAGAAAITVVARDTAKAASLHTLADKLELRPWSSMRESLTAASMLVNTTPIGMHGSDDGKTLSLDGLPQAALVTDIVYNPLETPLLALARAHQHPHIDGLGMLIFQAIAGFHAWYGIRPEVDYAELQTLKQWLLA